MQKQVLIAGGGIGGLAAALGSARAGWEVRLFERAGAFTEVGAGVQIGPNVVRRLQAWGLHRALLAVASFPERLRVRSALTGAELGALRLGATAIERYGAAYATIHRADLHGLLLDVARKSSLVHLNLDHQVERHEEQGDAVTVRLVRGDGKVIEVEGDALIGADGLRSGTRTQLLGEAATRVSGHLAYRAVLRQDALPQALRSSEVNVWLGPRLHAVHYPVRSGEYLNVVVIVHGAWHAEAAHWDHAAHAADLQRALGRVAPDLNAVLHAVPQWRLWPLYLRPPMRSAVEHAQGRIGLLGDAAHPMPPYLAQGAAMALEDAWALGQCAAQPGALQDVPALLQRWAASRWQRNAWVQARARRNGTIFHARGPLRWGRNWAMAALGESLLDVPALYAGPTLPF